MCLYYVPTIVANQFNNLRVKYDNLTIPIIKRKLTAMIWATDWRKELIDEENMYKGLYKHEFNGIVMIVDDKSKRVRKVYSNPLSRKDDVKSARKYKIHCEYLGLNSDRKGFKLNGYENRNNKMR